MTTKEFLKVAKKLQNIPQIQKAKKGEHYPMLGVCQIGSTDRQNTILWRKLGTLNNIIFNCTAENMNMQLKDNDVTEFIAVKTKSGHFCRLTEVKK